MLLSHSGGVPLSAESDYYTMHNWDDAGINIDSRTPFRIRTNFEVIEVCGAMTVTHDCVRTPDDFIVIDAFQY
jgi:hypothetical protein